MSDDQKANLDEKDIDKNTGKLNTVILWIVRILVGFVILILVSNGIRSSLRSWSKEQAGKRQSAVNSFPTNFTMVRQGLVVGEESGSFLVRVDDVTENGNVLHFTMYRMKTGLLQINKEDVICHSDFDLRTKKGEYWQNQKTDLFGNIVRIGAVDRYEMAPVFDEDGNLIKFTDGITYLGGLKIAKFKLNPLSNNN